jgi:hypothetical protein
MTSPLSKPKQNLNPWTHPPVMNLMQAPTPKPTPPELTSDQEQVIREHRLMLNFPEADQTVVSLLVIQRETLTSEVWG